VRKSLTEEVAASAILSQHLSSLPLLLLHLDLIFISISVLSFTVPRFVELDIGCLTEELDILPKGIENQFQQEAGATHMSLL
jgi:hypothetical protein